MTRSRPRTRRGVLIVCVLVCLLVSSAIATSSVHCALRARREVRMSHQMQQTQWLLDAGVHRAARALRKSEDYRGESWRPVDAIAQFDDVLVEIRVTPGEDGANDVEVVASLGVGPGASNPTTASRTQRSHRFQFRSPDPSSNSNSNSNPESSSAE